MADLTTNPTEMAEPHPKHDARFVHEESARNGFDANVDMNSRQYLAAAEETLMEAGSTWVVFKKNPRIVMVMLAVLLNAIIVGIELNMAGNMLGIQSFCRQFGRFDESSGDYAIPAATISAWNASFSPFQLVGMVMNGFISDLVGRRPVLYLIFVVCTAGACMESFVTTWQQWLGAKIVMGFTTGLMQAGVATYISEVSPRELRGISLSTFNMLLNMGNLFSVLISYGTETTWPAAMDDRGFRVPLYICIALPLLILVAELILVVESPGWLVLKNKPGKASKALKWLYPRSNEQQLRLKLAEIEYTVAKEAELQAANKATRFIDCFKGIDARRSFCAIFPALSQPLCGNIICGPMATYFFSLAGSSNALSSTAIVLSCGFVCNIAVFFVIDNKRIGRWAVLVLGLSVMFIGGLGIGIVGSVQPDLSKSSTAGTLMIVFVCVLACGSVTGPGAVGWTYTGESGSARHRAKTNTLGNLGNAAVSWILVSVVAYMLDVKTGMGYNIGYFHASLSALSIGIVYFFIPDYTGRSYAQVDELFGRRIKARDFSKTVCTGDYGREIITTKSDGN